MEKHVWSKMGLEYVDVYLIVHQKRIKYENKRKIIFWKVFFCLKICASNGFLYRNLCEMERDRCIRGDSFVPVDPSYCKLF